MKPPQANPESAPRPGAPASDAPPHRYTARLANEIESRWQTRWERDQTFRAPNPGEPGFDRFKGEPKKYVLDMFPYPSGAGLHVGHPLGYIATDIYARYCRMTGHNVLHAMGYDAFGLPAEQYAVQTGQHPRITTENNIANMRRQLRALGLGHDARRSVATTDVAFYKWTQWIFLQIYNAWFDPKQNKARPISELIAEFEKGARKTPTGAPWQSLSEDQRRATIDSHRLAYLAEAPVNWCPALGTVLANEEVTADGRSERGNHPVYRRPMKQWMMRITAYAERLLADLEPLDWPEPIKLMQRNWIGRSEGASIDFRAGDASITVFTTRPDTLFGATYMVLAPEHPLVERLTADAWPAATPDAWKGATLPGAGARGAATPRDAVQAYKKFAAGRSDVERQVESRQKTGVFIGAHAVNPGSGERIPIFIADYVLMGYGTGAIMAVPAHDERDYDFARAFDLPIRDVVMPRLMHAVWWFLDRTEDPESFAMGWDLALADFLGYITSKDIAPSGYDKVYDVVSQRRGPAPDVAALLKAGEVGDPTDRPEAIGGVRGAIQLIWLETISEFLPKGFSELKRAFRGGEHLAARGEAYTDPGYAVNSPPINTLQTPDAKPAITKWLEDEGAGAGTVNYKLRDWLFSRQRYWGEPFPIVYDDHARPHDLPESMLPVELPELENFAPEPMDESDPDAKIPHPPLARARDWTTVTLDLGDGKRTYTRELNTMPQWAGSCWYYLRYLDPQNNTAFCAPEVERYWMLSKKADGAAASPGGTGVPPVPSSSAVSSGGTGVPPVPNPSEARSPASPRVEIARRNLPHWTLEGSTYFVTFRLRHGKLSEHERRVVLDACLHWHGDRAEVRLVTVMPDHVHLILRPLQKDDGSTWTLSELLHSIKGFTSHEITRARGEPGPFWQEESFDRIVRDLDEFNEKWNYMQMNPVNAGLAPAPEAYPFTVAPDPMSHRRDACATGFDQALHHIGGVDLYVGGAEHAVLHLLYARFWHKVLFDLARVSTPEPFGRLFNQGYIQAAAYTDSRGVYVPAEEVVEDPPNGGRFTWQGKPVSRDFGKMGKSLKNSVTPDEICRDYGADTLRLYEMYMGPLDASKPWNTRDIIGVHRFLQRVWRNFVNEETGKLRVTPGAPDEPTNRLLHKTIAGVRKDLGSLSFNTAIAKLIELNNHLTSHSGPDAAPSGGPARSVAEAFTLMLAPLAPHMAEELWSRLGHETTLAYHAFPEADPALLAEDTIELPVQVNGKLRAKITVPANADAKAIEKAALADEKVTAHMEGKPARKVIVVPGKLVNVVV